MGKRWSEEEEDEEEREEKRKANGYLDDIYSFTRIK